MTDHSTPARPIEVMSPRRAAECEGISLATFWRRVKDDPAHPKPIKLSANRVGVIVAEHNAYIAMKIAERDAELAAKAKLATAEDQDTESLDDEADEADEDNAEEEDEAEEDIDG